MMDKNKTKAQLINELEELRTRIASLQASAAESERVEETLQGPGHHSPVNSPTESEREGNC